MPYEQHNIRKVNTNLGVASHSCRPTIVIVLETATQPATGIQQVTSRPECVDFIGDVVPSDGVSVVPSGLKTLAANLSLATCQSEAMRNGPVVCKNHLRSAAALSTHPSLEAPDGR